MRHQEMELIVIGGALAASFGAALVVQKAVLDALLRAMFHQ
jgi:hypothetical protein